MNLLELQVLAATSRIPAGQQQPPFIARPQPSPKEGDRRG